MALDPQPPAELTPLPAARALEAYFLDARARLLELAATLDRIDRGTPDGKAGGGPLDDPRLAKVRLALLVLLNQPGRRAEAVQQLFSHEYDPAWVRPRPRLDGAPPT